MRGGAVGGSPHPGREGGRANMAAGRPTRAFDSLYGAPRGPRRPAPPPPRVPRPRAMHVHDEGGDPPPSGRRAAG